MLQQQEGPSLFTLRGPVRGMIIQGISGRRLPARPAAPDFTSLVGLCLLHPLAFCCFFLRFFLGIHTPTPPLTPGPLPPPPCRPALPPLPCPALSRRGQQKLLSSSGADMHQRYPRVSRALSPQQPRRAA